MLQGWCTDGTLLRGCSDGGGLALPRGLDFILRLHGKSQPSYPGITRANTFISPRNPESDICIQVFVLYPTHRQTELVK